MNEHQLTLSGAIIGTLRQSRQPDTDLRGRKGACRRFSDTTVIRRLTMHQQGAGW